MAGLSLFGRQLLPLPSFVAGLRERRHEGRLSSSQPSVRAHLRREMPDESARCLVGAVFGKLGNWRLLASESAPRPRRFFHEVFLCVDSVISLAHLLEARSLQHNAMWATHARALPRARMSTSAQKHG